MCQRLTVSHKVKQTSDDPAISLLSIYPREMKTCVYRQTCTGMFISAVFIIIINWKEPKGFSSREDEHTVAIP